ncbi:unnamed protein product [Rotaria sordida]|uniref:Uncharacterized protein n=1 Tax=Rotaria sordida TaxID=392033 RepID=A0A818N6Y6_9BILA|nr:unnamed protein product [Rotaria sordida]
MIVYGHNIYIIDYNSAMKPEILSYYQGYLSTTSKKKNRSTLSIDHLYKITKCTLENEAKDEDVSEFITRFDQFNAQIKRVEQKIEDVDKRVNKKVDQLPQKIDNNYETNAT